MLYKCFLFAEIALCILKRGKLSTDAKLFFVNYSTLNYDMPYFLFLHTLSADTLLSILIEYEYVLINF